MKRRGRCRRTVVLVWLETFSVTLSTSDGVFVKSTELRVQIVRSLGSIVFATTHYESMGDG